MRIRVIRAGLASVLLSGMVFLPMSYGDGKKQNAFSTIIEENFDKWDLNHDNKLSFEEVERLMLDPRIKGEAAAAVAAVHHFQRSKKGPQADIAKELLLHPPKISQKEQENERIDLPAKLPNFHTWFEDYLKHIQARPTQLFDANGPSLDGVHQGRMGDCFFVSTMGGTAQRFPRAVEQMIRQRPDGTFDVHFPGAPPMHVGHLTDAEFAMGSHSAKQGLWMNVCEKAYGIILESKAKKKTGDKISLDAISHGGAVDPVMQVLTAKKAESISLTKAHGHGGANPEVRVLASRVHGLLTAALSQGHLVGCATGKTKTAPGVVTDHAYSILGYDARSGAVHVWNPWGNKFTPKGDPGLQSGYPTESGQFSVPLQEFVQIFTEFYVETGAPLYGAEHRRRR